MADLTLPWLEAAWQRIAERLSARRLPHALLITGQSGVGKSAFAEWIGRALLCDAPQPDRQACGHCRACRLNAQATHPDFARVSLEEKRRVIRVDQIRKLIEFLSLKSQYGGYRVGLIDPADHMNVSAANSLLKTLEEPPADAVLLLVASEPHRLPATIRSRCQKVSLAVPPRAQARAWLRAVGEGEDMLTLAGGAPLRALAYAREGRGTQRDELLGGLDALARGQRSPVEVAQGWLEQGSAVVVPMLLGVVGDLIRLATLGTGAADFRDGDRLQRLANGLDLMTLHRYLDRLTEARRHLEHPLNEQLLLEELFIGWQRLVRAGTTKNR